VVVLLPLDPPDEAALPPLEAPEPDDEDPPPLEPPLNPSSPSLPPEDDEDDGVFGSGPSLPPQATARITLSDEQTANPKRPIPNLIRRR
jgi:hypothetical protein